MMPASKKRTRSARKPTRTCPACASADVVPIVWGLPNEEDFKKAEAGEFALGGCCVSPDDPKWHCKACGKDFGRSALAERIRPQRQTPRTR
jgi:hypothetical protein